VRKGRVLSLMRSPTRGWRAARWAAREAHFLGAAGAAAAGAAAGGLRDGYYWCMRAANRLRQSDRLAPALGALGALWRAAAAAAAPLRHGAAAALGEVGAEAVLGAWSNFWAAAGRFLAGVGSGGSAFGEGIRRASSGGFGRASSSGGGGSDAAGGAHANGGGSSGGGGGGGSGGGGGGGKRPKVRNKGKKH
jgi:hypothetical protein